MLKKNPGKSRAKLIVQCQDVQMVDITTRSLVTTAFPVIKPED